LIPQDPTVCPRPHLISQEVPHPHHHPQGSRAADSTDQTSETRT